MEGAAITTVLAACEGYGAGERIGGFAMLLVAAAVYTALIVLAVRRSGDLRRAVVTTLAANLVVGLTVFAAGLITDDTQIAAWYFAGITISVLASATAALVRYEGRGLWRFLVAAALGAGGVGFAFVVVFALALVISGDCLD